jgi:hypothetical protein
MKKQKMLRIDVPYVPKTASQMNRTELCRWFALMNMMKFINLGENLCRVETDEDSIPHNCLLKYVNEVSGDLEIYLKEFGGVPFKYSLDTTHADSQNIEELQIAFH